MYAKQKMQMQLSKQNENFKQLPLYDASIAYFNWKKTAK
jgi:hypothetical protein